MIIMDTYVLMNFEKQKNDGMFCYNLPCSGRAVWYCNYQKEIYFFYCEKCKAKIGTTQVSKKCKNMIDQKRTFDILAGGEYYDIDGYKIS